MPGVDFKDFVIHRGGVGLPVARNRSAFSNRLSRCPGSMRKA